MCLCLKETSGFQRQQDLLNMSGYWFGHDFPTKASRVKNIFPQPFRPWPSAVSYFRVHCEGKKRKIDPSHESV